MKKMFNFSLLVILSMLLVGCSKKISTEEVVTTSLNNFNSSANYDALANFGVDITANSQTVISFNGNIKSQVDNANKIEINDNDYTSLLLFFEDNSKETIYNDYNALIKYRLNDSEDVSQGYFQNDLKPTENISYIAKQFLENGIVFGEEVTEFETEQNKYYVIPSFVSLNTLDVFTKGVSGDSQSLLASFAGDIDLNTISQEDKDSLNSLKATVNYFVYKDTLYPARIEIDTVSLMDFCKQITTILSKYSPVSEETSTDEDVSMNINLAQIECNLTALSIDFINYNQERNLIIPQEVLDNLKNPEVFGAFNDSENGEAETAEEDFEIEEEPEEFEVKEELLYDFNDGNFGFNIGTNKVLFPLTGHNLEDYDFEIEIVENEMLEAQTYSVPIKAKYGDSYINVIFMNNTEEALPLKECDILSIEIDSLFFEDSFDLTYEVGFESTLEELVAKFGEPSYKYMGETSWIYTYQMDDYKYIDFQIDVETNKICYIKLFFADI